MHKRRDFFNRMEGRESKAEKDDNLLKEKVDSIKEYLDRSKMTK